MFSITGLFKTQTEFEKSLKNSSIVNNSPTLNIADLKSLMLGFNGTKPKTPQPIKRNFEQFFLSLPHKPNFMVKFKILASCHVFLDDFMWGASFSENFINWGGFTNKEKDPKKNELVMAYYEIILRFAHSHTCVRQAKSLKNQQIKDFDKLQEHYYKAINLLNSTFQFTDLFFKQKIDEDIYAEAILLIWNDVIALYLFFEKLILQFLVEYMQLEPTIFNQIYELLLDFIRITEKIRKFQHLSQQFQDAKTFIGLNWKVIDKQVLEELLLHQQKLKIQITRKKLVKQNTTSKLYSFTQTPTTPQHHTGTSIFTNTTLAYAKRLSTADDPFLVDMDDAQRRFKNIIDKK